MQFDYNKMKSEQNAHWIIFETAIFSPDNVFARRCAEKFIKIDCLMFWDPVYNIAVMSSRLPELELEILQIFSTFYTIGIKLSIFWNVGTNFLTN